LYLFYKKLQNYCPIVNTMKEKIMIKFLKSLFGIESPAPVATPAPVTTAPYKVPEPAATTPTPLVVEAAPVVVVEKAPAKAPAKPKVAKPAAAKAPAKPKAAKAKAPATKKPKISIAK
jgi:hypothetical protein